MAKHRAETILVEGERSEKREYELGITTAALVMAETGSVVLDRRDRIENRASTLVETHIVVVEPSQIVANIADALATRKEMRSAGRWGDFQVIVTGPSRTADVEKVLVIPAHGPRRLILVLCDEKVDLSALNR